MYVGGSRILTSGSDTVLTLLNSAFVIFMNNSESINTLFWNKEGLIVSKCSVGGRDYFFSGNFRITIKMIALNTSLKNSISY